VKTSTISTTRWVKHDFMAALIVFMYWFILLMPFCPPFGLHSSVHDSLKFTVPIIKVYLYVVIY